MRYKLFFLKVEGDSLARKVKTSKLCWHPFTHPTNKLTFKFINKKREKSTRKLGGTRPIPKETLMLRGTTASLKTFTSNPIG
jgi:hypothetical protein